MAWKNKTLASSDALMQFMNDNDVKQKDIITIMEDSKGYWHIIHWEDEA